MANNVNLNPGLGIALSVNSNNLTIQIDKTALDRILDDLKNDNGSVLKDLFDQLAGLSTRVTTLEGIAHHSHNNTSTLDALTSTRLANIENRIVALENGVVIDEPFTRNFDTSGQGVTYQQTRAWAQSAVVDAGTGIIDFGDNAASSGANSNAKIYIEY